jgi:sulfide:quinone oxidoreductase
MIHTPIVQAAFLATAMLLMPKEYIPQLFFVHGFSMRMMSTSTSRTPKKLLIVGGGIGGLSSAFDAKHNLRPYDEVTVVSDRESFQFTPSNPWVSTRIRKPEDISLPLEDILPKHKIEFVHGRATHLDTDAQELKLEDGRKLPYDYLIVATGPRLAFDEIPGATAAIKANVMVSVCTTPHASHAADQVDKLVENPGPIVVGATQGASCFGPAYEFALILQNELKKRGGAKLVEKCPITFVTPEPYIGHLGLQGAGESQSILESLLTKQNIAFYTNCKINKVGTDHVSVTQVQSDKNHGSTETIKLASQFTMLIPPFRGHDVWKMVPKLTDNHGMIKTNEFQQSTAYPNIFGVGVCVSIPAIEETPVATGPPKTGYMIESQGTAAVKNIRTLIEHAEKNTAKNTDGNASHHDQSTTQPSLRNRALLNGLCITDFGGDGAIFLTLPQYPPRRTDITIHGKLATLAKIAFEKYFLHKIETGDTDPYYETYMLHLVGVDRVTSSKKDKNTAGSP